MKMWVPAEIRGIRFSTALMIKIMETKEEEEGKGLNKGQGEAVLEELISIVMKKRIKPMNVINDKE